MVRTSSLSFKNCMLYFAQKFVRNLLLSTHYNKLICKHISFKTTVSPSRDTPRRRRYAISTGFLKHSVRVSLKFIKQEDGWMRGIASVVPGSGEIYALLWVAVAVEAWSPSSSSPHTEPEMQSHLNSISEVACSAWLAWSSQCVVHSLYVFLQPVLMEKSCDQRSEKNKHKDEPNL